MLAIIKLVVGNSTASDNKNKDDDDDDEENPRNQKGTLTAKHC